MKKLYCVYDKIKNQGEQIVICSNEQEAIRTLYPVLSHIAPMRDFELRYLGEFEQSSCEYIPINDDVCFETISWDCYKFPISQAENLSVFGDDVVEAFKQNQKHQMEKKDIKTVDEV